MQRRKFLGCLGGFAIAPRAMAQGDRRAILYKSPQCGCCEDYANYLRDHGYRVDVIATHDLDAIRARYGVPQPLTGCHTTLVDGYVVEGHVPAGAIGRLLRERPRIRGISLPGMPQGSPGMTGRKNAPFTIYEIRAQAAGEPRVYAVE